MANGKRLIWDEDVKRHLIALAVGHHTETLHIDMILNAIFHYTPTADAIPISVIKRAIAGINAADQCDQAGRRDFELRNALETVLKWYDTPAYKEYERSTSK